MTTPPQHGHQPKRHASLPALNLVTAQQVEVDLLLDPPSPSSPERRGDYFHRLSSHPPWPHSPSDSSVVTPSSGTGIYVVLDDGASDSGQELSGQTDQDPESLVTLSDLNHFSSHLKSRSPTPHSHSLNGSAHHGWAPGPCSSGCPSCPGAGMSRLTFPCRKPPPHLTPLDLAPGSPLDEGSDAISVSPAAHAGFLCDEEQPGQWAVSLGDSTCSPWSRLQLPLAPETPPEACFPALTASSAPPPGYPALEPEGPGLPAISSWTAASDGSRSLKQFNPLGSLSPVGLGRGTNNNLRDNASDKPDLPGWSGRGGSGIQGMHGEPFHAFHSGNQNGIRSERRRSLPSLPTLVLHTSSSTSLLLDDTADTENFPRTPNTPFYLFDDPDSGETNADDAADLLASIPFDISPIRPIAQRIDPDDHAIPPRGRVEQPPGPSRHPSSQAPTRRTDRRSATAPVEVEHAHAKMRRKDRGGGAHLTSIETLFAQPKQHGLGAALGPLFGSFGLKRSLSVGGHGGPKGLAASASSAVLESTTRSSTPQNRDRRPERYSASTSRSNSHSNSARSSCSNDGLHAHAHAHALGHAQGLHPRSQHPAAPEAHAPHHAPPTPTSGGKLSAPVSPTSAHGPCYPGATEYGYPTSPHRARFESTSLRYHYLPSSSREASPRSPCFPVHYDHLLSASDSASLSTTSPSASSIGHHSHSTLSHQGGHGHYAGIGIVMGHASADNPPVTGVAGAGPSALQESYEDNADGEGHVATFMDEDNAQPREIREGCQESPGATGGDASRSERLGLLGPEPGEEDASGAEAGVGLGVISGSQSQPPDARSQRLGSIGTTHSSKGVPSISDGFGFRGPQSGAAVEAEAEADAEGGAEAASGGGEGADHISYPGHRGSVPKDDNSPTLEPVRDSGLASASASASDDHHSFSPTLRDRDLLNTRPQPLPPLPSFNLETPSIQASFSSYHTYPTAQTTTTLSPETKVTESRPSKDTKHTRDTQDRRTTAVTAVGSPVLPPSGSGSGSGPADQLESSPSHHNMERELWNIQLRRSPRPSPLPSPSPSQGIGHDGSPLSPTTTSSGSIHDTKSIKEKSKKKGGWFQRKSKDEDEPQKPIEKKKKKKPAYGGGAGYLDSLMLPPGQPLGQPVYAPGGGRVATKSPRRKASSVEPLSPTWSHSQPDSDRARSLRRPSSHKDDNNGLVVEIAAHSSPPTPHHIPLPPLTPQSTSGQSVSQRNFSQQNQNRPPLPTQTPQTPNTLPLSLSPRSSTLRLDPLPNHPQHGSGSDSGSLANKELRDSRRHSQYTISSFSGSDYAQSLPSATMQRGASTGIYTLGGERPSVSTVFEEEYQLHNNNHQRQPQLQTDRRPSTIESDDSWARESQNSHQHHRTGERPSALHLHQTLPTRRQYAPSPGLPTVSLSPRTQRSSTISSTNSVHSKPKNPASHPFASGRAPSPNQPPEHHLTPPTGSLPGIPPSHSFPSFNENYRMPAPVVPAHQVALASPEDEQGDPDCPVCCESMSFTFRLPGEKPHVVPECGHALHEECFVTVYGPVPPEGSQKNIGVCGVCRQPMRVNGNDRSSGKNKLATLMGGSESASSGYEILDPQSDDPLEPLPSPTSPTSGRHLDAPPPLQVVVPRIEVRPEFQSVRRSRTGKQTVTALVVVEVPPAADRSKYPARQRRNSAADSYANMPPSPSSSGSFRESVMSGIQPQKTPFANVLADLKRRLVAYKYSGLESVGALCLFDILKVRKSTNVQDFHLYLFQDALICVSEERKAGITGGIFKKSTPESPNESILRMRGRIFLRDVHHVNDSSTVSELSIALTLETQEHGVDSIVICFNDRNSHEMWRSTIKRLIEDAQVSNSNGANAKIEKLLGQQRPPSRAHSHTSSSGGRGNNMQASTMNLFQEASETCTHSCPTPCPGALAFNVPIAPHHTPIDIVIAIATPALAPGAALPLKTRLMRTALHFALATMGPRDRIAIVAAELGTNAIVRRTPLLNATRHDSRKRLEQFVEGIGHSHGNRDEFEIETQEDKPDVVTAVNVALDVILQRKVKNPLGGLVLISDASDLIKRQQMDLVTARLDAAKIPVHCFGYGKAHDPSPLWMISNHTHGTYTFVKEWYHLRDALAGVVGGLMSIALTKVGLRLACQDDEFKVIKVSGASQAVISSSGRDIDIDLNILRHGEVREILVDFELESDQIPPGTPYGSATPIDSSGEEGPNGHRPPSRQHSFGAGTQRRPSRVGSVNGNPNGNGLSELALRETSGSYDDGQVEEVPVVEVDCTFHDPLAGRSAARMMNPLLLTLTLLPPSSNPSTGAADSVICRRRMELLASDMITRALLAGSRKNFNQATRVLRETKRILETKSDQLRGTITPPPQRSRRDIATLAAIDGLSATIQDVDMILDGIETNQDMFEMDYRNYAAQQTVILRTQRSWTIRTPTEVHYATPDVQALIQQSGEYAPRAQ